MPCSPPVALARRGVRWRPVIAGVALLAMLAMLNGCGQGGDPALTVGRAEAATPVSGSSQIVVEIRNDGDGGDRLLGAETPAALAVEIHLTEIVDGRATMGPVDDVQIPSGETVRFRPGGLHLMMVVPDETVVLGGTFELTLEFERTGAITVPVEVVDLVDLAESTFDDPPTDPDT